MKYFLFLVPLLFISKSPAQAYFTTAGIRLGTDYGLSLKQRLTKKMTAEAILWTGNRNTSDVGLTALLDQHRNILFRNFNLFYGAGLSWKWNHPYPESNVTTGSFGIPVQAGIELTIGRINLTWDYTPILYISTKSNAFDSLKGLSVRYVFMNKREGKKLMKSFKPSNKSRKT